ncbi:uncharacterized protein METZ01_LOCUS470316, partial [marine metagenome]
MENPVQEIFNNFKEEILPDIGKLLV